MNTNTLRHTRHSAGSLVAVDAYFEAPERIAALILVAPAILAPRAIPKVVDTKGDGLDSTNQGKPRFKLFESLHKFIKYVTQAIIKMMKRMADMLNSLYKKALLSVLRSSFAVMLVLCTVLESLTGFWLIKVQ